MTRLRSWFARLAIWTWFGHPNRFLVKVPVASGLHVCLFLGAAAVLALTCLSSTVYRDAPAIMQVQAKEKTAVHHASIKKLPVVVLTLEGTDRRERTLDTDDGLRAMQHRMAVNILLRSGYLSRAVAKQNADGSIFYAVEPDDQILGCVNSVPTDDRDLSFLGIAVVAAEKFNRSKVHRFLEWHLAEIVQSVTGRLPDLSLGVAQVRPSTVRRYAGASSTFQRLVPESDDANLRVLLRNECRSIELATAVLQVMAAEMRQSKRCSAEEACLELAVLRYGGHRHRSQAVVDYLGLVTAMNRLLAEGIHNETENETENDALTACNKAGVCDSPATEAEKASPDEPKDRKSTR